MPPGSSEEKVAAIRVELALIGFSGIFDNSRTRFREYWLHGQMRAKRSNTVKFNDWLDDDVVALSDQQMSDRIAALNRLRLTD